jgi:hypothetical protein
MGPAAVALAAGAPAAAARERVAAVAEGWALGWVAGEE